MRALTPVGSLGQCNWSRAQPETNYTARGFPRVFKWVKAHVRGLYPTSTIPPHGSFISMDIMKNVKCSDEYA